MSDAAKDQQDFLEMVTKVLEGVEGVIAVLPDAANLTLGVRREGFEDVFLALRPLYEELASIPEERHASLLSRALLEGLRQSTPLDPSADDEDERLALSDLPPFEEAGPRLYPVLGLPIFGEGAGLLSVPFLPLVNVFVAFDEGDRFRLLAAPDAARLRRSTNALLAAGMENLAKLQQRFEPAEDDLPFKVFRLVTDDAWASSRLCIPGLLPMMMQHVEGPAVAAVPDRDTFLVGSAEEESLAYLLETAERIWSESEHKVSPMLYCVDKEGELGPLEVGREHPLADELARMRALFVSHVYEEQGKALRAWAEDNGEDVAIPELTAIEHPELGIVTVTPFARGAAALLPLSDLVFLSWAEGDDLHHLMVRREQLVEVAPRSLLEMPDHHPPRFLTATFPDPAQLAQLADGAASSGRRPLGSLAGEEGGRTPESSKAPDGDA
jgi:hypothetical protein